MRGAHAAVALAAALAVGCGDDGVETAAPGSSGVTSGVGGGGASGAGGGGGEGGGGGAEPTPCDAVICPAGRVCVEDGACIVDLDPGDAPGEASADFETIWTFYDEEYGAFPARRWTGPRCAPRMLRA